MILASENVNVIGMIDEGLDKLFERLLKKDSSRTSQTHYSSRLELAIAKRITELHQGSIWVENNEGDIDFKVRLPIIRKE
jgi:signal transduction histidine kinase